VADDMGTKIKVKSNSWNVCDNAFCIDMKASAPDITSLKQKEKHNGTEREKSKENKK
jgi:hypothetical protein